MRFRLAALTLVLVAAFATRAEAFQWKHGPYLQHVTRNAITVMWQTSDVTSGVVRYGQTPDLPLSSASSGPSKRHEVRLDMLVPGSHYYYAVYEGDEARSETYEFRTDPGPNTAFRFVLVGDNRSDLVAHGRVVEGILVEPDIDFVLNTGDMVASGEIAEQWDEFFDIERELVARLPVYPAIGNHEEDASQVYLWEDLFAPPTEASDNEHYYAFTYGNTRFIVLDQYVEVQPWYLCALRLRFQDNCLTPNQESFLLSELAGAAADPDIRHTFVAMHEGPYSSKEGRSGSGVIRSLLSVFLENGVDLIVSGHDHYYEHGLTGNGIDYIISGGGGAPLYDVNPSLWSQVFPHTPMRTRAVHHYAVIDVDGDWVQVTVKLPDGTELDQFEVGERTPCTTAMDCANEEPGACPGDWACGERGTCEWVCEPPPSCVTASDCPEAPEGACEGYWECAQQSCVWRCTGGECEVDGDCSGLEPLNACPGGHYICTDLVCEWICPPVTDVVEPDAGSQQDAGVEPDVPPDTGVPEEDVPEPAGPDTTAEDTPSTPGPDGAAPDTPAPPADVPADTVTTGGGSGSSGGCRTGSGPDSAAAFFVLLLAFAALRRRRTA